MEAMRIKKWMLLAFAFVTVIIMLTSCQSKDDVAPKQDNGLNYVFVDYIGPDSCKLYRCAYHEPGTNSAGDVFLTVCKDKPSTVNWSEQHGKTTSYYSNDVVNESKMPDDSVIKQMKVVDTVIKMVSKMVPETSLVVRFKRVQVKK